MSPRSCRALVCLVIGVAGCGGNEQAPTTAEPAARPESPAAPPREDESQLPLPNPGDARPWKDCGRIRSPVDRDPQRVEAITFDCRAARRVASRYLKDRSLPHGWGPADCAASRASCEQGGWAFRVVEE